jgi:hypothetical protein
MAAPFVTNEDTQTKNCVPTDRQGPPVTTVWHAILLMAGTGDWRRGGTSEAVNMSETVPTTKG